LLSRSFSGNPVAPGDADLTTFFPAWFVKGAGRERDAALDRVSAFALPMLGRLLDELSASVGKTIDGDILRRFNVTGFDEDDARKDVLIRGMLRQGLQVLAGSEAELATKVARLLLNPVPGTPSELLGLFGELLLWLLAYKVDHGHTAIILTMGRDMYRGRLSLDGPDENNQKKSKRKIKIDERRLIATLAGPLVDTSSIVQERVLREIAKTGWNGELRTNPTWASLGRRVTVHSQGGCPMGTDPNTSVTKPSGELHQCDRLYVMDAAAFPASVGVNPSATILAVAEHKIEQFIREHPSSTKWAVPKDAPEVLAWATPSRKKLLDPLNNDVRASDRVFEDKVISLTFREEMSGQFNAIDTTSAVDNLDTDVDPEKNQQTLASFGQAEDEGRHLIRVTLDATVADLARLISTDKCVKPAEIKVTGTVEIGPDKDGRYQEFTVKKNSFIQMFARPRKDAAPVRRFFNYRIWFDDTNSVEWLIDGRKVLRDDLGQDMWQDVSTLYFEMSTGGEPKFRGILRLSFNDFLQKQLKSMTITGTPDPTRQMWALLAFYRYFARELLRVYVGRTDEIVKIFSSAITGINV
jgi:hypothetical protein